MFPYIFSLNSHKSPEINITTTVILKVRRQEALLGLTNSPRGAGGGGRRSQAQASLRQQLCLSPVCTTMPALHTGRAETNQAGTQLGNLRDLMSPLQTHHFEDPWWF